MFTGRPSKRISPESAAWMPAIVLISVDFPAPLSPTSAMISPRRTSRSTSLRAWTEPNDLEMSRSSRMGGSADISSSETAVGRKTRPQDARSGRPVGAPTTLVVLAELLELPDADVALLEEAGGVDLPPVRLVERNRRDDERGLALRAVGHGAGLAQRLPLDQLDGGLRGCLREHAGVLPDRHRLPARDDVLEPLRGRVLPRHRDRL